MKIYNEAVLEVIDIDLILTVNSPVTDSTQGSVGKDEDCIPFVTYEGEDCP